MSAHLARAWQLYELHRDKLAVEELQQHLAEWPEDAEAYQLLTFSLARLKDSEGALAAAQKCVELAPEDGDSYYAKAVAEKAANHWLAAEAALAEAIRLDPTSSALYVLLAEVQVNLSQYEEAVESTERALASDPGNASAMLWQGFALWSMNCVRDARAVVQRCLEINPNDSNLRALLGTILDYRGQREAAVLHLLEAMRIDPENHWAHERLQAAQRANGVKIVRIRDRVRSKDEPRETEEPTRRFTLRAICVYSALMLLSYGTDMSFTTPSLPPSLPSRLKTISSIHTILIFYATQCTGRYHLSSDHDRGNWEPKLADN